MRVETEPKKIVSALLEWFVQSARDLPWRRTQNPYAIWVSEIMLQQTQVKTVLPFWQRWMQALPTIQMVANARSEHIHKLWEGLGYYTRVRNLQKAAQLIVANHSGVFPQEFHDVLALPGIGRYTAGAICSIAFNQPKPILDGNVVRVLTRLFGIQGNPRQSKTNAKLWRIAEELVLVAAHRSSHEGDHSAHQSQSGTGMEVHGPGFCSGFNQALMELGALLCTPRQPQCGLCPAATFCVAYQQDRVDRFPNLPAHVRPTPRRFIAFVREERGRFLLRQRAAGVVNAHLWEFPNVEVAYGGPAKPRHAARKLFGLKNCRLRRLCAFKHSITRYRITLETYRLVLKDNTSVPPSARNSKAPKDWRLRNKGSVQDRFRVDGRWISRRSASQLPFTSAHKKVLLLLLRSKA